MRSDFGAYYEKYDINKEYRHPNGYDSTDDDYPPDWTQRRQAIIEHFGGRCGRCHREIAELDCPGNAHHYRPLGEGGTNELANLILLCGHCHDAIHPNDLDSGTLVESPIFPHVESDNRVAVIREPVFGEDEIQGGFTIPDLKVLLDGLEAYSTAKENRFAVHERTYAIGPEDAVDAQDRLEEMIYNRIGSPYELLNEADFNKVRPPELVQNRNCPRCEETELGTTFVGFPIEPTRKHLTIQTEDEDEDLYPLCPSCAKKVYQSQNAAPEDVCCFGNIFPRDLETAPHQPDELTLEIHNYTNTDPSRVTCLVSDQGTPIEDAEIRVDGETVAKTDDRGRAHLTLENVSDDVVTAVYRTPTLGGSTPLTDSVIMEYSTSLRGHIEEFGTR